MILRHRFPHCRSSPRDDCSDTLRQSHGGCSGCSPAPASRVDWVALTETAAYPG